MPLSGSVPGTEEKALNRIMYPLTLKNLQSSMRVSFKTHEHPNKCTDMNHGKSHKGKLKHISRDYYWGIYIEECWGRASSFEEVVINPEW